VLPGEQNLLFFISFWQHLLIFEVPPGTAWRAELIVFYKLLATFADTLEVPQGTARREELVDFYNLLTRFADLRGPSRCCPERRTS